MKRHISVPEEKLKQRR